MTNEFTLMHALQLETDKNYLFDLDNYGVLDLVGENARDFLQGQISCDVREVGQNIMRQGALCNLKGRILALLDVLEYDGLKLILPTNMLESTKSSLDKSAILSRVKITPSSQYCVFGFFLQNTTDLCPFDANTNIKDHLILPINNGCAYHRGNNLFIVLIEKSKADLITAPFIKNGQWRDSLDWHATSLAAGQIEIYPETRGLFLPHRLDLHKTGHLSFNKGCYKGQEIIARTHYRATLKHKLEIIHTKTSSPLQLGMPLFTEDQKTEIGELIDFCKLEDNTVILAASVLLDAPSVFLPQ